MTYKKIHIIINPGLGKDEPILSYLHEAFKDSGIEWEVSVIKKEFDARDFARQWIGKADVLAVYGGDGTIAEVGQVLKGTGMPLAIIPGGTANVIAKELGIPLNPVEAIAMLKGMDTGCIEMDMAEANDDLFMIRVNLGIMADMVIDASRGLKNKVGQLAYGLAAIQSIYKSNPVRFSMKIDGLLIEEEGVALTVTNCGSIGMGGYTFLPEISITDGWLDVILLHQANIMSVLKIAGTTLLKTDSDVWKHWKCKEIEISFDTPQNIVLDDTALNTKDLHIKILPHSLKVIVPLKITS